LPTLLRDDGLHP